MKYPLKLIEWHDAYSDNGKLCDLFTIPLAMIAREQTFRRRSLSEELQK